MDERHVVTCFLLHRAGGDRLLLARRSQRVHTYPGRWAAISGSVETTPDEQALAEIHEETGLTADQVHLLRQGAPLVVDDPALDRRWIVHPYLFAVADPAMIRLDWEHDEGRWIAPAGIGHYATVPRLIETLARVYPLAGAATEGRSSMEPVVSVVLDGYREVYQSFRAELETLDPADLHRQLGPETNSIAVLVHHTLGSAGEVLRLVAGRPAARDREAEFRVTAADLDVVGLRAEIDAAEALLDELGPLLTAERLATTLERPNRNPHTGLYWLVTNYGHAREHLAHLQLTRQALAARR